MSGTLVPDAPSSPAARPPPGLLALTREVAAHYAGASHFARNFVRGKLLTDPVTPAMLRLAAARGGFGDVVDLGCGRGQAGLALLTAGLADRVRGLDLDPDKIADATRASRNLPAHFAVADLGHAAVPPCDTALIFDVLLQMPEPAQQALIVRMATAVRRRIVIRAFDPDRGWRTRVGAGMEQLGRRLRRDGSAFRPLPLRDIAGPLRAGGFRTDIIPCWGWTPLPNVLLVAERIDPAPDDYDSAGSPGAFSPGAPSPGAPSPLVDFSRANSHLVGRR